MMFATDAGDLVHCTVPLAITPGHADIALYVEWERATGSEIASEGEVGKGGVIFVTMNSLINEGDRVRIPEGEVAFGFQFEDGGYSNFVPLVPLPKRPE
jgi:hypothetical protein